jgi:hypothetical protein
VHTEGVLPKTPFRKAELREAPGKVIFSERIGASRSYAELGLPSFGTRSFWATDPPDAPEPLLLSMFYC